MDAMHVDEPEKTKGIDAEYLSGRRFPYQEDISLARGRRPADAATPGEDINWLEDIELLEEDGMPGGLRPLLELVHQDLLPDPRRARERDRPQGADHAPAVGQLLRHPAEGEALPSSRSPSSGRGSPARRRSARTTSRPCSRAGSRPRTDGARPQPSPAVARASTSGCTGPLPASRRRAPQIASVQPESATASSRKTGPVGTWAVKRYERPALR